MTLSGSSSNLKPSIDKPGNTNKSERILSEPNLPGILNRPVSPVLHGDRDYEDQNDVQRTVITSGITQEDIEFYDQLEEKQEKNWKRRLKQDEEYKRELLKVQSRVLEDNTEDNIQPPDNKVAKKSRSFFEEDSESNSDNNKGRDIPQMMNKSNLLLFAKKYVPLVPYGIKNSKNYKEAKLQQRLSLENARKQREAKGLILDSRKTLMMSLRDNTGINWGRSKQIMKHLEMHHRHPNVDDKKIREQIANIIKVIK
ncbi:hypothetical protein MACJ_002383 [Theileria orientalis]|uniref:Uncharacterized protein n=1 Tax=Theileria orientalis TaxID=68886 RepID=A0A976QRB5_THEOR|nr:hypothetical protein MACJ_002383 [Theileria orientalis]